MMLQTYNEFNFKISSLRSKKFHICTNYFYDCFIFYLFVFLSSIFSLYRDFSCLSFISAIQNKGGH